jgi:membrane associated rhomboid family serine protease
LVDITELVSLLAVLAMIIGPAIIFWRKIPIVFGLIIVIIFVYILQIASSTEFHPWDESRVFLDLAFTPSDLVNPPYFYTVFTSMFLHASTFHLVFNLFALFFLGIMLERRIGSFRFLIIYIIAGLIGGLTWAAIHWDQAIWAVGASGAILGTLGAFARLYGHERIRLLLLFIPLPPMRAYMIFVMFLIIDLFIAFTSVLPIAAEAHIGGAIAGFLIAPYVMKLPSKMAQPKQVRVHRSTLEELATTNEMKEILNKIETETEPDVQQVWFAHFLKKARCPRCGGPIWVKGNTLYSDCGWRTRL